MRDLKTKIEQEMLLAPQTVATTFTSSAVSTADCNELNIAAVLADQPGTLGLEESVDNLVWTAVTNDLYVIGQTLSAGGFDATSGVVTDASYVGSAGYVRLSGTVDAETEVSVHAIKGGLPLA